MTCPREEGHPPSSREGVADGTLLLSRGTARDTSGCGVEVGVPVVIARPRRRSRSGSSRGDHLVAEEVTLGMESDLGSSESRVSSSGSSNWCWVGDVVQIWSDDYQPAASGLWTLLIRDSIL
jgi:hypothetical protein